MQLSQRAYDMIHYTIRIIFGYFYVCEIYVNLIWYLYLFMLNKFCLSLSHMTLTFCMDITFVNGNNSKKFYDDLMKETLWKRWHKQTDRQTDGQKCS